MTYHRQIGFLCIITLFFVGCGQNARVTGTVTFSDGKPLPIGRVVFTSADDKYQVSGMLDQSGVYRLDEDKRGSGVKPGEYGVSILQAAIVEYPSNKPAVSLIHRKYDSPETSGLTTSIKARSDTVYDITVDAP